VRSVNVVSMHVANEELKLEASRSPRVDAGRPSDADLVAVPVRHYGQFLSAGVVLIFIGLLCIAVAHTKNFQFSAVPRYLFDPTVLAGVKTTLELTVLSMALGVTLGVIAAVWKLSTNPVLRWASASYIWFFRGTPAIVQLIFWFNIGIIFPTIRIGLPFTHLTLWQTATNSIITPFTAAIFALGINEGAYVAEIVRAGIISVGKGQLEAAYALGMDSRRAMRRVVLPQAVPVVIPPLGNEFISILKYSALASVIAVPELLGSVENIYSTNLLTLELLVVASIWYIACTTTFSIGQHYLERHFARGRAAVGRSSSRRGTAVAGSETQR